MKLGLYIHIPFCRSKCPYCDFNSYPLPEENLVNQYIRALYKEIELHSKKMKEAYLYSIYLGGGTPTIISGLSTNNLIKFIKSHFKTDDSTEITIEANPGTINRKKLELLFQSGINRLSLGSQSFNDNLLKKISRIHTSDDIIYSYIMARETGFKNINIDIMYALPEQTFKDLQSDLHKDVDLKP